MPQRLGADRRFNTARGNSAWVRKAFAAIAKCGAAQTLLRVLPTLVFGRAQYISDYFINMERFPKPFPTHLKGLP